MPYLPKPKKRTTQPRRKQKTTSSREDKRFLDSKAWKIARQRQLQLKPTCEACQLAGIYNEVIKGGHIDHIVRRKDGGSPLSEINLQTLCKFHHDRKNGLEKNRGGLVAYTGNVGERIPAPGEKQRLLHLLIGQYENTNNGQT